MKLAILSDIHGNRYALDAVLRDIDARGVDRLVVNGDLVNRGPHNVEVLERLLGQGHVITLGNHDDLIRKWVDRDPDLPASWYDDPFWRGTEWTVEQLACAGLVDALRELPMTHEINLPDAPRVLISHGSPRHYREGYGSFLPDEMLAEIIQMYPADLLIGSHTHRPYERRWGRHTILNTGAVGAPFNGDPRAQYLLLTLEDGRWTWAFLAVPYDRAAALAAYETTGYVPEGELSAFIFREELRYALPIYAPFWMWAEERDRPMTWESWHAFRDQFASRFVLPESKIENRESKIENRK